MLISDVCCGAEWIKRGNPRSTIRRMDERTRTAVCIFEASEPAIGIVVSTGDASQLCGCFCGKDHDRESTIRLIIYERYLRDGDSTGRSPYAQRFFS